MGDVSAVGLVCPLHRENGFDFPLSALQWDGGDQRPPHGRITTACRLDVEACQRWRQREPAAAVPDRTCPHDLDEALIFSKLKSFARMDEPAVAWSHTGVSLGDAGMDEPPYEIVTVRSTRARGQPRHRVQPCPTPPHPTPPPPPDLPPLAGRCRKSSRR